MRISIDENENLRLLKVLHIELSLWEYCAQKKKSRIWRSGSLSNSGYRAGSVCDASLDLFCRLRSPKGDVGGVGRFTDDAWVKSHQKSCLYRITSQRNNTAIDVPNNFNRVNSCLLEGITLSSIFTNRIFTEVRISIYENENLAFHLREKRLNHFSRFPLLLQ